jgi:acyl carrier protein
MLRLKRDPGCDAMPFWIKFCVSAALNREVELTVREAVEHVLGHDRAAAAIAASNMLSAGFLDSFALIELAAELEVRFAIKIPTRRIGLPDFANVSSLAAMCAELKSK